MDHTFVHGVTALFPIFGPASASNDCGLSTPALRGGHDPRRRIHSPSQNHTSMIIRVACVDVTSEDAIDPPSRGTPFPGYPRSCPHLMRHGCRAAPVTVGRIREKAGIVEGVELRVDDHSAIVFGRLVSGYSRPKTRYNSAP